MIIKKILTYCFIASPFCFYSCNNHDMLDNSESDSIPSQRYEVLLKSSNALEDYSEVYVFNGQTPRLDFFHHQVLEILKTSGFLKMKMPEGKWNAVIVGCNESNIKDKIQKPSFVASKAAMPMWVTQPINGLLPEVPEIRTALINGLTIEANSNKEINASLERNVAKVRVVLKDGIGFKVDGTHAFLLKKVPTTLAWDGSLFPNKKEPATSNVAMKKEVRFYASSVQGHQKSDIVDFIIPAHKSLNAADTTTHKLVLGLEFTTAGSTLFKKDIIVQTVPKNNQILLLNVTAKGGVEVSVDVQEWKTVTSTDSPSFYEMSLLNSDSKVVIFQMKMLQERNWWLSLEDKENFEFENAYVAFGQITESPVTIKVRRKTAGGARSTKLNLFVEGILDPIETFTINNLIQ